MALSLKQKKTCSNNSTANLVRGGKEYFDLLEKLIEEATHTIHLQVYIFDADETGQRVATALKNAAAKKVSVHLMADGYASQSLPKVFIRELESAGIQFRFFDPLLKSRHFYFGRRLHHKVLVVDNRHALVAGINISNRYNDIGETAAWLDFGLYAAGGIAQQLQNRCLQVWEGFSYKPGQKPLLPGGSATAGKNTTEICMKVNDWVYRKREISRSYVNLLLNAKKEVIIMSSYFLPGKAIRRQIAKAAARGARIKIVTTGFSDVVVSKLAERWLYDWLLRKGAEIYEYKKNVVHAKIAVFDGQVVTAGSYNINNISAHASIELNLDVHDEEIAGAACHVLNGIILNDCEHITPEKHLRSKNIFRQFARWVAYQSIRLLIFLFTFYFRPER